MPPRKIKVIDVIDNIEDDDVENDIKAIENVNQPTGQITPEPIEEPIPQPQPTITESEGKEKPVSNKKLLS